MLSQLWLCLKPGGVLFSSNPHGPNREGWSADRYCCYLDLPTYRRFMIDAQFVLTDSGGIQEETTALGVACLTLRDSTERPVTVTDGTNTIVGTDPAAIEKAIETLRQSPPPTGRRPALWDGSAAARIVDILESDLSNT